MIISYDMLGRLSPETVIQDVVFMQGEAAREVLTIIEEQGEDAGVNHLMQWDYDENQAVPFRLDDVASAYSTYIRGIGVGRFYLLCYHQSLEYAGLQVITDPDPERAEQRNRVVYSLNGDDVLDAIKELYPKAKVSTEGLKATIDYLENNLEIDFVDLLEEDLDGYIDHVRAREDHFNLLRAEAPMEEEKVNCSHCMKKTSRINLIWTYSREGIPFKQVCLKCYDEVNTAIRGEV